MCEMQPSDLQYKCAFVQQVLLVVIQTRVNMGWRKILLLFVILIKNVTSQLSQYGSSSGGDSLPSRDNGGGGARQGSGGFNIGSGSSVQQGNRGGGGGGGDGSGLDHQGLDWLRDSVPGEPGVDYPIYSLPVPDSSFSCDGRVILNLIIT